MIAHVNYFEYESPCMSFFITDEELEEKYDEIWGMIKYILSIKFHSEPLCEYKYLKTKEKEYDMIPEYIHCISITCITIDSVAETNERYFPQVYLEEWKYPQVFWKNANIN